MELTDPPTERYTMSRDADDGHNDELTADERRRLERMPTEVLTTLDLIERDAEIYWLNQAEKRWDAENRPRPRPRRRPIRSKSINRQKKAREPCDDGDTNCLERCINRVKWWGGGRGKTHKKKRRKKRRKKRQTRR